jgi:hypothetical protein
MKLLSPALLALTLAACAHTSARSAAPEKPSSAPPNPAPASPAPTEVVLEIPGDAEHPTSLQTLLEISQKASGWNFTYTQETAEALRASSLRPFGTKRVPAADFPAFLDILLTINGFHCEPIGPEHARVLLITVKKT